MNATKTKAVLFDFDGVVVDTEAQYSKFWHRIGEEYLGMDDMEGKVKGQTLVYIYDAFFNGRMKEQAEITESLNRFEQEMSYDFIPGVLDFIEDLRRHNVKTAVVTSSNEAKMASVYRVHPEIKTLFDRILTAELFAASKPAPDCFLLGMEVFGTDPADSYVFEDSFNGLKAGIASGATVIGLTTTNSREAIAPLCHHILDDFIGFTYDKLTRLHK
ncbi:HAD family hydrolase [Bacteroides heparinolyticus]|uniref:HAD family phosphatase n=4 Tax=Prevotella heparinolytica TaxID=28113 RepID=A0A3P2A8T6_9BACE|nr:HAD family phosphatase [Bacteroides heparinolyticus]MCI6212340.1 HAD family phosphatase [Bacteroides heparinolyticus]RRD91912.1 HAD family phosphatase [Bacteroides heparinolyticus]VFB14897.1 HAD-superfamily hydrolase, subfamily IA, variant 3 [Bacteroides heparinolyticus]